MGEVPKNFRKPHLPGVLYRTTPIGDFRIVTIHEDGSFREWLDTPAFERKRDALAWLREHGDKFIGFRLAIVRYAKLVRVDVHSGKVVEERRIAPGLPGATTSVRGEVGNDRVGSSARPRVLR